MAYAWKSSFWICCICLPSVWFQITDNKEVNNLAETKNIQRTLAAIERIVDFYQNNVESTNLDGLFGLRALEGILESDILNNGETFIEEDLKADISKVLHKVKRIVSTGEQSVEKNYAETYKKLKPLVSKPYVVPKKPRFIERKLEWHKLLTEEESFEVFDEEASDNCFREIFLSIESNTCQVTSNSMSTVLTRHTIGYPLLHQLLFFGQINLATKCEESWIRALRLAGYTSQSEVEQEFCANSFHEMCGLVKSDAAGGKYPSHIIVGSEDLFFEHQFVCPSLGFYEFLRSDYLDLIIRQQHRSGCYKDEIDEDFQPAVSRRSLQEERELEDGCLFHMTSVAVGALSQYLYYGVMGKYNPSAVKLKGPELTDKRIEELRHLADTNQSDGGHGGRQTMHSFLYIIMIVIIVLVVLLLFRRRKLTVFSWVYHRR